MASKSTIQKLRSLRVNRNGEENAFRNLVDNLYGERMFVNVLLAKKLPQTWDRMIIAHYIVSLVTCWETFFRDVFVFLVGRNPTIIDDLNQNIRVENILRTAPIADLNQAEFVASAFNFQNMDSLSKAFAPILGENNTLDLPADEQAFVYTANRGWSRFCLSALFPGWKTSLDFILQERHRIIHDANHACTVTRKTIQELEPVLFFYLQFFGIYVSVRFGLPWIALDTTTSYLSITSTRDENERNIVITFEDLLSDDWETLSS